MSPGKIILACLFFSIVVRCLGEEKENISDSDIDPSSVDANMIAAFCDTVAMAAIKNLLFKFVVKEMMDSSELTFEQEQLNARSQIDKVTTSIEDIVKKVKSFEWLPLISAYLRVKVKILADETYRITEKTGDTSKLLWDSKSQLKAFMDILVQFYKVNTISEQFIEVAYQQIVLRLGDTDFIGKEDPKGVLSKALCVAYTSLNDQAFLDKNVNADNESVEFLRKFFEHFVQLPVEGFALTAMCMTDKNPHKDIESKIKIVIDKPPESHLWRIEWAFLIKNYMYFINPDIYMIIKKHYIININWYTFLKTEIVALPGFFNTGDPNNPTKVKMNVVETTKGYFNLHLLYLYLISVQLITETTTLEDIKKIMLTHLTTNECWINSNHGKAAFPQCTILIELIPEDKYVKFVWVMILILKIDYSIENIKTFITTFKTLFIRTFNIKFIDLIEPNGVAIRQILTELKYAQFITKIQELVEPFNALTIVPPSQYLDFVKPNTDLDKIWKIYLASNTQLITKEVKIVFPSIEQTVPGPELHILHLYVEITSATNKQHYDQLYIIIKTIWTTRITKVNRDGFKKFFDHTFLKSVGGDFYIGENKSIQIFRIWDYQMILKTHANVKTITDAIASKKETTLTVDFKMADHYKYRWGHSWFLEVVSVFSLYEITKNIVKTTLVNDLRFFNSFNTIYILLCKIRETIQTPVTNARKFLWEHMKLCVNKVENDKQFASCPGTATQYKRTFAFIYFWLINVYPEAIADYENFEKESFGKLTFSGNDAFFRYVVYPGNQFEEEITGFCAKREAESKNYGICLGIELMRGLVHFIDQGTNLPLNLFADTQKVFTKYKATDPNKKFYIPFLLDAYVAANALDREAYSDGIRVALRRWRVDIQISTAKEEEFVWKELFTFDSGKALATYIEPILAEAKLDANLEKAVKAKFSTLKLDDYVDNGVVMHSALEFLTRYARGADLEKICTFIQGKENGAEAFLSYHTGSANIMEKKLKGNFDNFAVLIAERKKFMSRYSAENAGRKVVLSSLNANTVKKGTKDGPGFQATAGQFGQKQTEGPAKKEGRGGGNKKIAI